jgi:hypothetical protein
VQLVEAATRYPESPAEAPMEKTDSRLVDVYMTSTAHHPVEYADGPPVTVSFTCDTDATRRNARLHVLHQRMRGSGLRPSPVGVRPVLDTLADAVWRSAEFARLLVERSNVRTTPSDRLLYALLNPA